ncbi:MAG: hypothetical protein FWC10_02175 [Lentimicrobiaceae bacterium]|nr:hypothetical protein [Lentimicrobiaceae bacterium]
MNNEQRNLRSPMLSERANLTKQYAQQATAYLCALSTRAGFALSHRLPLAEANGNYTFTPINH